MLYIYIERERERERERDYTARDGPLNTIKARVARKIYLQRSIKTLYSFYELLQMSLEVSYICKLHFIK